MEPWKGEFKFRGGKIFCDFLPLQKPRHFACITSIRISRFSIHDFDGNKNRIRFHEKFFSFFPDITFKIFQYSIKKKKKNNIQLEKTNFLNYTYIYLIKSIFTVHETLKIRNEKYILINIVYELEYKN